VIENPQWEKGSELFAWMAGQLAQLLAASADPNVRDPVRAVALAAEAEKHESVSGDVWNKIGEAYFRAQKWDKAIPALKKAGDLRAPHENVTGWFHLAMAYWRIGEKEQARQWYDRAAVWMEQNTYDNPAFAEFRTEAGAMLGVSNGSKSAIAKGANNP
jgi:tetratricopeptide (TPR) repeat protein